MRVRDDALTRRERQIMDVLYRCGAATASEVRVRLDQPSSYSTIRTQLGVLATKGHVVCRRTQPAYVYAPAVSRHVAGRRMLKQVVETYFQGSTEKAIAVLHAQF